MRILKYLFLLLLLSLVALSIFIATQKGDYTVERSKIINAPKAAVFNYVNDYRNWSDFGSWVTEDPEIKIAYPQNTIGKGASFSWEANDGDGKMQTLYTKDNDSIVQKMEYNGSDSKVFWNFKDTIGGTKVSWKTKGKMSFSFKIYTALNGGIDRVIGSMYEKSLVNLDKALDYEINTFSVKVAGIIKKPTTYYLGQTFTSEISKINKNFKIVVPKIDSFCKDNNVSTAGKPFIIYHTYDLQSQLAHISICVPIQSEIFISSGSDITSGKLEIQEAVKATLTGDNSHNKAAYDQAVAFISKNVLNRDPTISHLEIYTTSKKEVKDPSKWQTEVLIPIIPKVIVPVRTYTPPAATNPTVKQEPLVGKTITATPLKIKQPVIKATEPKKPAISKPKAEEESEF